MNTGYSYKCGGKMKQNGGYIPSMPQYGFGSWLKENAGVVGTVGGTVLGGAVGSIIPGAGTALGAQLGATIGGSLGGAVQSNYEQDQMAASQQAAMEAQLAAQQKNNLINSRLQSLPQQQSYASAFAANGGYIPSYGNGGGIYIKPENRGKFTATKKRTGKTTEELTHSKNPLTRKRAIFAQNAVKWNKEYGGPLDTSDNPDIISIDNGGTHENSFLGGVPISNALVEEGELIANINGNKYVFSNRF